MQKWTTIVAVILCLTMVSSGCSEFGWDDSDDDPSIGSPTWEAGIFWDYAITSDDVDIDSARMVMAGIEGENYVVGTSTVDDARRHAVLNINPLLGRVRLADLSVYENGEPQVILDFPLEEGKKWSFSYLGVDRWDAEVERIRDETVLGRDTNVAYIHAEGSDGTTLDYQYDSSAMWIRSLEHTSATHDTLLRMLMVDYGDGWSGRAYFVRGTDLIDHVHESSAGGPVVDITDTYVDEGHPSGEDFTDLIYFVNFDAGVDAEIYWALRDHLGTIGAQDFYSNEEGSILGTTPSVEGDWTLLLEMEGNADIRIRVAGGIEYSWIV